MVVTQADRPLPTWAIAEVAPVRLGRRSTVRDVVQAAIADGLDQLIRFAPGACVGSDPEDVHKARVATRRLRSQLKSFSVAFDTAWVDQARTDLGWLADALGAVRDVDVMAESIHRLALELPEADRRTAGTLLTRLQSERAVAVRALCAVLGSGRCRSLLDRLHAAASEPPVGALGSDKVVGLAHTLVAQCWKQLDRSASGLPGDPSDGELHDLRIRTKRCRYTTELLVPVLGSSARRSARALSDLQGVLGDIHDSHSTQTWLRAAAEPAPVAFVAGMMVRAEALNHASLTSSWRRIWRKAEKAKPNLRPT